MLSNLSDVNPASVLVESVIASGESLSDRRKRLTDTRTCEIVLTRERAYAAFRTVAEFQCADITRFHLCGVAIALVPANEMNGSTYMERAGLQLVATDGLTLARVRVPTADVGNAIAMPDDERDSPILKSADVARLIKALMFKRKADGAMPVTIAIVRPGSKERSITVRIGTDAPIAFSCVDSRYVPYSQVIPAKQRTGKTVIGLNPALLARLADGPRMMGRETMSTRGITMSLGDELDPVRIDWADPELGEYLAVIMPIRL